MTTGIDLTLPHVHPTPLWQIERVKSRNEKSASDHVCTTTQCFRDGRWPHIGLKFNASESNENQTGGTRDVVGKHWM